MLARRRPPLGRDQRISRRDVEPPRRLRPTPVIGDGGWQAKWSTDYDDYDDYDYEDYDDYDANDEVVDDDRGRYGSSS